MENEKKIKAGFVITIGMFPGKLPDELMSGAYSIDNEVYQMPDYTFLYNTPEEFREIAIKMINVYVDELNKEIKSKGDLN